MIRSFKHKGLKELFEVGGTRLINKEMHARCLRRLDLLNQASKPEEMNVPGFNFHALKGDSRYTVHVNGPWCVTFEFQDGNAENVDFEQYH
ncbi:MAG TPA: type II toxin-antitoxin system RelE/ParE family toxin [Xanthobacteraceae bacterium]|jgi:proteic killer suppression protein|nr:type II toxin-antitoxin system RelE/ParE family toxin [Xanthobacteraceae bacterium]